MKAADKMAVEKEWIHTTGVDATQAGGTVLVTPWLSPSLGTIQIVEFGFRYAADTSAAVTMTTCGQIRLNIMAAGAGTGGSHTHGSPAVPLVVSQKLGDYEYKDCNANASTPYTAAPDLPEADLHEGEWMEIVVETQGVGGTQSVIPYFKYRQVP